ncbi:MAG: hypothetical protein MJ210_00315 [Alphaproteobacteria bacterium]|nr:hypothetical protein [Alphaproteobacteria bacterium]
MTTKFQKEREEVLNAVKNGISDNMKLSKKQKKYIKNLLLFALMNASENERVTKANFIKLVNKTFKGFLLKILKESLDDDDDEDWDSALEVELNKIIASDSLLKSADLQEIFTPDKIVALLKSKTTGVAQKDLIKRLLALREAKANYRETPQEQRKREHNQREYELARTRQRMMENTRQHTRS